MEIIGTEATRDEEAESYLEIIGIGTKRHEKAEKYLEIIRQKMPVDDWDDLLKKNVKIVLPEPRNSYCKTLYFYQQGERADPIPVRLIVLNPSLLSRKRSEILYTMAHEIAHAFLGHDSLVRSIEDARNKEIEADTLVIKWGFEKELRACPDNYLYGLGMANTFTK